MLTSPREKKNNPNNLDLVDINVGVRALPEVWTAQRDPYEWLRRHFVSHKRRAVGFAGGRHTNFVTSHPDDAQHVLQSHHWNYVKSEHYDGLRETLGNGLVTSEGDFWRRQRKLAQPAFGRKTLANFVDMMDEITRDTLGEWGERDIDLHQEMMMLTMRIIARTMFSIRTIDEATRVSHAVDAMMKYAHQNIILNWPRWVPTKRHVAGQKGLAFLDNLIYGLIESRRASGEAGDDFLGVFMSAAGEDAADNMTNQQIRDEMLTIFAAGHETTATALTWFWQVMQTQPEVFARVTEEAHDVLDDGPATAETVGQLKYIDQAAREVLRLYPPVWMILRKAIAEDVIAGHLCAAGSAVMLPIWAMHRNPEHWPDPERFDPSRFSEAQSQDRHRFAYLPFGGGPRICIGAGFALLEIKLIIARMVRRFSITGPKAIVRPCAGVTLRPSATIPMQLRRRRHT